jgi:nucleotide-binding universal stress UspA family protein
MRIDKVLVPIDFSAASTLAVNCAITFARRFRGRLSLVHVLGPSDKAVIEEATRRMCELVAPEDQDDLDLQTNVKSGSIHDEIMSVVHEQRPDLVVMGTHSRAFIDRLFIGSVTLALLRRLELPLVTVAQSARPLRFDRILFATDLSEGSISASSSLLYLARVANSKVTFLHVVEKGALEDAGISIGGPVNPDYAEQARAKLHELTAAGGQRNVQVEPVLAEGVPAKTILKTAKDTDADLIVITPKHKGLVERTLLGSTAERVIREANVPVLSIPISAKGIKHFEQQPAA